MKHCCACATARARKSCRGACSAWVQPSIGSNAGSLGHRSRPGNTAAATANDHAVHQNPTHHHAGSTFSGWLRERLEQTGVEAQHLVFAVAEATAERSLRDMFAFWAASSYWGAGFAWTVLAEGRIRWACSRTWAPTTSNWTCTLSTTWPRTPRNKAQLRILVEGLETLGAATVVGGVEEVKAMPILWSLGVDLIQGFFLQRPYREMSYDFSGRRSDALHRPSRAVGRRRNHPGSSDSETGTRCPVTGRCGSALLARWRDARLGRLSDPGFNAGLATTDGSGTQAESPTSSAPRPAGRDCRRRQGTTVPGPAGNSRCSSTRAQSSRWMRLEHRRPGGTGGGTVTDAVDQASAAGTVDPAETDHHRRPTAIPQQLFASTNATAREACGGGWRILVHPFA